MKDIKMLWPVLVISGQFNAQDDEGFRLRELVASLKEHHDLKVIPSFTYEDGYEIFRSRADFGCIVVDWDIPEEDKNEKTSAKDLIANMRKRHKGVPILLLAGRLTAGEIPLDILENVNGFLWKTADTIHFMSGRIDMHLTEYVKKVYPCFFGELVKYANEYKYAWHTPGHMGGTGFLRSPAGVAFFKFYGENAFR